MPRRAEGSRRSTGPKLVTIKDAAKVLGVAEITLRRWDDAGKFTARRHPLNGYRLYKLSEVIRLRTAIHGGR